MKKLKIYYSSVLVVMLLLSTPTTAQVYRSDSLTLSGDSLFMGNFPVGGNYFFNKPDTIKAVMLITYCNNCPSKSATGYIVTNRQYFRYRGDVFGYLDNKKKPFPPATIIWDYRLTERVE